MTDARSTSASARRPAEGAGTPERPVRVVLLGETGLDASLRGEASVETVRPRTPLEAVGEVAAPPASSGGRRTIVVVGEGGEPAEHRDAFVEALRRADPDATLVRVGRNGEAASAAGRYDAVLGAPATAEMLRGVLGGAGAASAGGADIDLVDESGRAIDASPRAKAAEKTAAEPSEDPVSGREARGNADRPDDAGHASGGLPTDEADDPPMVMTRPVARDASADLPGDGPLLAMLGGSRREFEQAAIRLMRDRLGLTDLRFEAGRSDGPGDGVTVRRGPQRFGRLTSGSASPGELAPHAGWLAAWLETFERQRSLRRAAFTDPLTGAWNRRYFDGFLDAALERARAARRTVTVLVFDIDEFKHYNDKYGHPAGDEILIETVRALKSSVRPSDRVCRIGGDEFAVIFDEPEGPRQSGSRPPESVYVLAKRVQRRIGEKEFPKLGADARGELTISGGLAAFPWDGHDAETLLSRADELACQSKRQGKNAITFGPGAERVCRRDGDDDRI